MYHEKKTEKGWQNMGLKLGFIGTGKMAQHFITGFLKAGIKREDIFVSSRHFEKLQTYAMDQKINPCASNKEVVKHADLLFIGVHPEQKEAVLTEIAPYINPEEQTVLSFMTGVSLPTLEEFLGPVKLVRLMPNLNVAVNKGAIALTFSQELDEEDQKEIETLLKKVGEIYFLPEKDFSTFVALAGSAPAFVYLFIDSLSRMGVKYGFSKDMSTQIVSQMVAGSGLLSNASSKTPTELMDEVASPGGSTIEGILALENSDFKKAIFEAFEATLKKDQVNR